jgi:ppGpp synthetase/RelA/SpoT-type nucleotidyltranferase
VGAAARGKFEPNPGVEDRRRRDEESFKDEHERSIDYVEQRLKEKSLLYNKFVRGEAQCVSPTTKLEI